MCCACVCNISADLKEGDGLTQVCSVNDVERPAKTWRSAASLAATHLCIRSACMPHVTLGEMHGLNADDITTMCVFGVLFRVAEKGNDERATRKQRCKRGDWTKGATIVFGDRRVTTVGSATATIALLYKKDACLRLRAGMCYEDAR